MNDFKKTIFHIEVDYDAFFNYFKGKIQGEYRREAIYLCLAYKQLTLELIDENKIEATIIFNQTED
jgi:hypothetical protein